MSTTLRLNQASPALPTTEHRSRARESGTWIKRPLRRLFLNRLQTLQGGTVEIHDDQGTTRAGHGGAVIATVRIHRPSFYRHAVLGGSLSIAEAYLRGDWDCDDLTSLFRLFVRNIRTTHRLDQTFSWPVRMMNRAYHALHANSRHGSRKNIHAHYDLGNDFFRLMLDDTMAYSSGIFLTAESTLQEASVEKMDRLCRRLELQASHHLLEIGTGWGGLALHAAANYGCRVTTTTISREQYEFARQRIADAGLANQVTVLLQDYRDLAGSYDRIVSVEMIEAVGHHYLDTYFRHCSELLRPDGRLALQSITMPEQQFPRYLRSVDFIQKYVFPGGCLPSVSSLLQSTARATDLRLTHSEDFGPHYARTIRLWRQRFHAGLDEIRRLGYPDRFIRLWDYYLSYCEAAFEEHYIGVAQIQFDKPLSRHNSGSGPDQNLCRDTVRGTNVRDE